MVSTAQAQLCDAASLRLNPSGPVWMDKHRPFSGQELVLYRTLHSSDKTGL